MNQLLYCCIYSEENLFCFTCTVQLTKVSSLPTKYVLLLRIGLEYFAEDHSYFNISSFQILTKKDIFETRKART